MRPRTEKQWSDRKNFKRDPIHRGATENARDGDTTISMMIDLAGADIHARDDYQRTPLHCAAAWNKNPGVCERLIAEDADLEARDHTGDTPLHWAVWFSNHPVVVRALVKAGANVNARDDFGRTPRDYAQYFIPDPKPMLDALADP